MDASWDGDHHLAADIATDGRWPRWGPRGAELGVGSVLAIRMSAESEATGALSLYAEKPHAFGTDNVDLASIFTVHAAKRAQKRPTGQRSPDPPCTAGT